MDFFAGPRHPWHALAADNVLRACGLFVAVYFTPLIMMWGTLHRFPNKVRAALDVTVLGFCCLVKLGKSMLIDNVGGDPVDVWLAIVASGVAIDLAHLKAPFKGVGIIMLPIVFFWARGSMREALLWILLRS